MKSMRCPSCRAGTLEQNRLAAHEMGPWLGLESVRVEGLPALRCDKCGELTFDGAVLDAITQGVAKMFAMQSGDLWPQEARFLRKFLSATQTELAARLGVDRTTVTRWETGEEPLLRPHAASLRVHVALHLAGLDPATAGELDRTIAQPPKRPVPRGLPLLQASQFALKASLGTPAGRAGGGARLACGQARVRA
ncbi:MAG TPA: helix-turn-helix domain-containing protein [Polyangiaceae bacterium]|nr:helix-turn-helix domain-containing protein [Polyangiaceae bacterium]